MNIAMEKSQLLPILPFVLSGSRPLPVFLLCCYVLSSTQLLPILFSWSQLWRWIWYNFYQRKVYHSHPDVMFKPDPFYTGDGWLGLVCNYIMNYMPLQAFICLLLEIFAYLFPIFQRNLRWNCLRLVNFPSNFIIYLLITVSVVCDLLQALRRSKSSCLFFPGHLSNNDISQRFQSFCL